MTRNEIYNIDVNNIESSQLRTYDDFYIMCEHLKMKITDAYVRNDLASGDLYAKALMVTQNLAITRLADGERMQFIATCI